MTERWPDIAGRIEGGVHVLPVRVYYEDTDFSGFVYHANYLKFCERARGLEPSLRHARENGHPLALPVWPTGVMAYGSANRFPLLRE